MNRIIKFRAWDKHAKHMFPVFGLGQDWVTETTFHGLQDFSGKEFRERIVIMQYTNFQDVLGKDIYEGDIIQATTHRPFFEIQKIVLVSFDGASLDCEEIKRKCCKSYYFKILGNKFENPELLEKQKIYLH